jgi:hypothetical protein
MKRALQLFFFLLIFLVYFLLPREDPDPSQLSNTTKDSRWNEDVWISLTSSTFTNLLSKVSHNSELNLNNLQSNALYEKLLSWSIAYSNNSFDKFLIFRSPDTIKVENSSLGFRLDWLQKYRNVVTNNLSENDLLRLAYDFESKSVLREVSAGSLAVQVQ